MWEYRRTVGESKMVMLINRNGRCRIDGSDKQNPLGHSAYFINP